MAVDQSKATEVAPDRKVESFILEVLDDYEYHDIDDVLIEVDKAFSKAGMPLFARQLERCMFVLIDRGDVHKHRRGDSVNVRRRRNEKRVKNDHPRLFDA